ncbi:Adenylate cyclase, class 3 [Enhydrobacter aerosaccus]|uniref:Adenylate cyclase, class 3 n=1 Tax=Enhydrobacter aerosaccus TaxID=225324 RepID=A0A1T4TCG1_9HYPH|nr:adenylate/guanylate cyclase domain-containing protein [Enhydrobacter aerosaccus]SKA38240.1 Adenylate cyclase, class 3 [Enhydrobacter aerosaccus]
MKRKVGLFLLSVIVLVTLATTLIVSTSMYHLVSGRQDREIRGIESSLSDRFTAFTEMLRGEHSRAEAHLDDVLPKIAADLDAMGKTPSDLTDADLDRLARTYGVRNLYFIDRAHKVFQTNLPSDKGLQFPSGRFSAFLDTVYGRGKPMSFGIDMSTVTGILRTYGYFGPAGKDYVLEASTDVRADLADGPYGWMSKYFFEDFFNDALRSNIYVKQVDIFLETDVGFRSLLYAGKELAPAIVREVERNGRYSDLGPDGRLLTVYSRDQSAAFGTKGGGDGGNPSDNKVIVREVTYDTGLALDAVIHVMLGALAVLVVTLPLLYWISARLLQKQLLDPLFSLREEAGAIAAGDLDHPIANTDRRDEIGHLAHSFDLMRGAVRRTILDLKNTNLSIGRFVPHAFLTLIGKPSIVSVQLGDNTNKEMTVLFSDIRGFTRLSEAMTPDENFAFINGFLESIGPVIRHHNGFIDKYIGDAIMALFERPDDAVAASLAMIDALDGFNERRRERGLAPIFIGIGLNTGPLMLGTIGERDRMDCTVISDAVNLASRVEQLTKNYNVSPLLSQDTYERLSDRHAHAIRPIDIVIVKGKTRPVTIYELFDRAPPAEREAKDRTRDLLLSGVAALDAGDKAAARRCFDQALALVPDDPAALHLLKKCG